MDKKHQIQNLVSALSCASGSTATDLLVGFRSALEDLEAEDDSLVEVVGYLTDATARAMNNFELSMALVHAVVKCRNLPDWLSTLEQIIVRFSREHYDEEFNEYAIAVLMLILSETQDAGAKELRAKTFISALHPYLQDRVGVIFADVSSEYRNEDLAHFAFRCATEGGDKDAPRRLAGAYEVGRFATDKHHEILDLIGLAADRGNGCALYDQGRWAHFATLGKQDCALAKDKYKGAIQHGCNCAAARLAELETNQVFAPEQTYSPKMDSNRCIVILASLVQSILGLGAPRSLANADSLVARFEQLDMKRCQHRLTAEFIARSGAIDVSFLSRLPLFTLSELETGSAIKPFCEALPRLDARSVAILYGLMELTSYFNLSSYWQWRKAALEFEAGLLGVPKEQVCAAQRDVGPVLNRLSPKGVPIPYSYQVEVGQPKGIHVLTGVRFNIRGRTLRTPELIGGVDQEALTTITGEDMLVALCLVFSGVDIVRPSLSIEDISSHKVDPRLSRFRRKEFEPEWLAATDFGRSMYFADWIMNRGVNTTLSITDPFVKADDGLAAATAGVTDELVFNHTPSGADSVRVMINLVGISYRKTKRSNWLGMPKTEERRLASVDLRVDGSGISYAGVVEDRSVGENDPAFGSAHSGIVLTSRYDRLCKAFPVFDRVRQLLALTRLLETFRTDGYDLDADLKNELMQARDQFAARARECPLLILHW